VGETGAGKTSILDAITLGLYGRTPRQRDITSSKNNLMTKLTAESYSEVIFRGRDNRRYRSRWYQHRAKKRADGNLQRPKVLLEEVGKKVIATKIEEWRDGVEKATGLNFDRFCKCVMLAQGNFSALLKADEKEKSEILEQITDSSIYREIGKRVFQETKLKQQELERLKERLSDIEPLKDKERILYQNRFENIKRDIEISKLRLSNIRDKKRDLESLNRAKRDLADIEAKLNSLKSKEIALISDRVDREAILNGAIDSLNRFKESYQERQELIAKAQELNIRRDEIEKQNQLEIDRLNRLNRKRDIELKKLKEIKDINISESKESLYRKRDRYLELKYLCKEYNRDSIKFKNLLQKIGDAKAKYSKIDIELRNMAIESEKLKAKLEMGNISQKVLELRGYLIDGEPCLVCGSREHHIKLVDDIPDIDIDGVKAKLDNSLIELENLKVENRTLKGELKRLRAESRELERRLNSLRDNIGSIDICLNIEKEIADLNNKISKAKKVESLNSIKDRVKSFEERVEEIKDNISNIKEKLIDIDIQREKLGIEGDIKSYKNSLDRELKSLIEKRDMAKEALDGVNLTLKEIEFKIEEKRGYKISIIENIEELNRKVDSDNLDKLNQQILDIEEEIYLNNQELGKIEQILNRDNIARERYREVSKELMELRDELDILTTLNGLIGSADGSKFAKFAQSVTMDYLIVLANRHLKNLNKRYILKQHGLLEFVIVDNYQADEIRPVSTLSGGEAFIVSLALALGLSDLAGENINIETLFLDEGFGTLDSQTLEIILASLDRLNSQGKIIGIISHIEAIKEAISLKIEVKKSGGFGYLDSKYRA